MKRRRRLAQDILHRLAAGVLGIHGTASVRENVDRCDFSKKVGIKALFSFGNDSLRLMALTLVNFRAIMKPVSVTGSPSQPDSD